MIGICITSLTENAGKTMLSSGLAQHWLDCHKQIGYFRVPSSNNSVQPGSNKDTAFMRKILALPETGGQVMQSAEDFLTTLQASLPGTEIMIVESSYENLSTLNNIDCKIVIVHDYSRPLAAYLEQYKMLGARLQGVVVNKIHLQGTENSRPVMEEEFRQSGIRCLGFIAENRTLMALSISDLAEAVQGKILNDSEKATELVENFMIGNSTLDKTAIFQRKANKAVLMWGEKPGYRKAALAGLQVAALQTSTRCIVINSNGIPVAAVAQKAAEKQIPLISAPGTIPEIIPAIENAFYNLKFNQEKKLPKLAQILQNSLVFTQLEEVLGFALN